VHKSNKAVKRTEYKTWCENEPASNFDVKGNHFDSAIASGYLNSLK
jgi:hypothetical protein